MKSQYKEKNRKSETREMLLSQDFGGQCQFWKPATMIRILVEGKKKEIGCSLRNTGICSEIDEGMLSLSKVRALSSGAAKRHEPWTGPVRA